MFRTAREAMLIDRVHHFHHSEDLAADEPELGRGPDMLAIGVDHPVVQLLQLFHPFCKATRFVSLRPNRSRILRRCSASPAK